MSNDVYLFLLIGLPLVAFLYASVGHGGASSYIAILTLVGLSTTLVKPVALILNIAVSGIAFVSYIQQSKFNKRLFLGLILFSVPASFLGGKIEVNELIFRKTLGILLLLPVARLFKLLPMDDIENPSTFYPWYWVALIGGSIGFVSGLIGIGGGIILSPVLLLMGWANFKETATISSLFIVVNSIAGLIAAHFAGKAGIPWDLVLGKQFIILIPLTLLAGIFGAYLGAHKFQTKTLRIILASVLLFASIKLLF